MSSGGSFWHRLRMRLGGDDAMLAQISDLVQKQIDANADVQEVTEESILNPIIIAPSKMVMRDNLFKVVGNTIEEGLIAYLSVDPDLEMMRLWVQNEHGGRYLTDHSFMGNKVQLNGSDQSKLIWSTVDDEVDGSSIVNQLIDDQYVRVEDKDKSPNLNVRIKEIAATAEGISVFIRLFVQRNENPIKPGVLFSKIDTEQVDFAYGAYLGTDGSLTWFVRDTAREYILTAPAASLVYVEANLPDYTDTDYLPSDYHTVSTIEAVPDPIPLTDLVFTFQFSNKRMQIIRSMVGGSVTPTVIADSNNNPEASGLVGAWMLNEGGDIGNTPDNPGSYTKTVYNRITTGNNGTITNATWNTDNYLNFDGNNDLVDVTNYTAIQNLSAFTISLWYYPTATPGTNGYLVSKSDLTSNSWLVYHMNTGQVRLSIWNATPTRFDITSAALASLNTWYHIVAKVTLGSTGKIFVNNVKVTGAGNVTGTVDTGSKVLRVGGNSSTNTPTGLIHDLKIFNRELSDAEVTTLYNAGHQATYLPKWEANPPPVAPPPGPITNPFVSVYQAPAGGGVPAAAEQDVVRLHTITATSLTERYNVGQGAQQTPSEVTETPDYQNDPTYDTGTAVQETLSTNYAQLNASVTAYAVLSNVGYAGERVKTGLDVVGKKIRKIDVKLCDANPTAAPATGTVYARIVSGTNTQQAISQTVDVSTLVDNGPTVQSSPFTPVTFTFSPQTYVMANDDKIQIEYAGGSVMGSETLSSYQALNQGTSGSTTCDYASYAGLRVTNTSSTLHGKVITKIILKLADQSTSSGVIRARIRNGSTNAIIATATETYEASALNGYPSWNQVTFTFTGNTTPMDGARKDFVSVEFNLNGPNNGMRIGVIYNGDVISNCNMGWYDFADGSGAWQESNNDWAANVYVASAESMKVGLAMSNTNTVANAVQYDAPWPAGSTITERTTNDVNMNIYFDAATGQPNHQYTQLRLDANKFVAEYVNATSASIYNKKLTKIKARVYRVGSPTGTLFCRIKKGAGGSDITFPYTGPGTPGTGLTVSGLGTASNPATLHTFENDDNGQVTGYALTTGDRVIFELSGGTSNSTNYVQVARTTTASTVPDVHLQTSTAGSTWTTSSNDDVIGQMFSGGYTPPPIFPYHTLGYVNTRVTQKVTSTNPVQGNIYNQRITQVRPWLKRIGSPTGTINVVIRNAADASVASINTFDASSVSNVDFNQETFTNLDQTYTMALNDKISIEFSGGDVNNHIQVNTNLLDTYPYGVLETYSSGYTTQTLHDLAGIMSSGGGATDPLARTRVGVKVATTNSAIKLKKISRITVYMKRTASPTGNVSFRIRNSADAIVANLGALAAGTIDPNTLTAYTIISSPISTYALQVGDHVSVEYNAGDDANFVEIMTSKTTDIFDGTVNTYLSKYNDVNWVPNNAIDLVGQMWEGGDSYTPSQEDVVIPDPKYTKDLTILAGGSPWTWVNHDLLTSDFATSQLYVNAIMPDFRFYRKVLTIAEITNINTNRTDRGAIAIGQVSKFAYSFISED